jgi:hypothetical protein
MINLRDACEALRKELRELRKLNCSQGRTAGAIIPENPGIPFGFDPLSLSSSSPSFSPAADL